MTPSWHTEFSKRLAQFSRDAKEIVENNFGILVYSGGDDVLAILPTEYALQTAKKLNTMFRQYLGERASMSAGICIAHHKHPLQLVLEEARDSEKRAKDDRRSSFSLSILKRGGEVVNATLKWKYDGMDSVD
jgi:CRISPR-associated protein Cmr2